MIFKSYLRWCLPKFYLNRQKCFNVSNNVTSIASIYASVLISGRIAVHMTEKVRYLMEYLFAKFQVFTKKEQRTALKKLYYIFPEKFECFSRIIFHLQLTKTCSCWQKDTRTVSDQVIQVSFDQLGRYFRILLQIPFLMKLQAFDINGTGGSVFTFRACDRACFSKDSGIYYQKQ